MTAAVRPSLAHDADHDAFAAAMVACQGYAPACSDAGECADDGWCFAKDGAGFAEAKRALQALFDAQSCPFTRSWLALALNRLEQARGTRSR